MKKIFKHCWLCARLMALLAAFFAPLARGDPSNQYAYTQQPTLLVRILQALPSIQTFAVPAGKPITIVKVSCLSEMIVGQHLGPADLARFGLNGVFDLLSSIGIIGHDVQFVCSEPTPGKET